MSWAQSLIRIREFEIETLRKRMALVVQARAAGEAALAALDAEAAFEAAHARQNADAGWYLAGFRQGWKIRKAKAQADLNMVLMEEQGCRDALADAFTELKKVEQVAENQAAAAAKLMNHREQAAMDEIALRRTGT
jgi:flagellar FliJ protein